MWCWWWEGFERVPAEHALLYQLLASLSNALSMHRMVASLLVFGFLLSLSLSPRQGVVVVVVVGFLCLCGVRGLLLFTWPSRSLSIVDKRPRLDRAHRERERDRGQTVE